MKIVTPEITKRLFLENTSTEQMDFLGLSGNEELQHYKDRFGPEVSTKVNSYRNFPMFDKSNGRPVGGIGFHTWYLKHKRAEIGYMIKPEFREKGLMKEAMKAIISYAFDEMDLHRIEAFVAPWNVPSMKLMQRFSFIREGLLREHYYKDDTFEDSICFSIIRPDYLKLREIL
jgi:[ribosomal protein S5]-alanine N-acetyltransferase